MSITVVGCRYCVNGLVFHFIVDKIKGSVKVSTVLLSMKTFVWPFPQKMESTQFVYGWKIRCNSGCQSLMLR